MIELTRRFFLVGAATSLVVASAPRLIRPEPVGIETPADWNLLLLIGGRGSGKTTTQSKLLIRAMRKYPNSRGLYLAETAWELHHMVLNSLVNQAYTYEVNDALIVDTYWKWRLRFGNGSVIDCATFEDARGRHANFVAIDEPTDGAITQGLLCARLPFVDGSKPKVVAGLQKIPAWAKDARATVQRMGSLERLPWGI